MERLRETFGQVPELYRMTRDELLACTKKTLVAMARREGIAGWHDMRKDDLVRELADRFHGFYHDCYVIGEGISPELTQARLWLVEAARVGLAIGLGLLGVSAPESM